DLRGAHVLVSDVPHVLGAHLLVSVVLVVLGADLHQALVLELRDPRDADLRDADVLVPLDLVGLPDVRAVRLPERPVALRIPLAARAFRMVRIDPASARNDAVLGRFAGAAPALLVCSADLTHVTPLYGVMIEPKTALDQMRGPATAYLHMELATAIEKAKAIV